LLALHAPGRSIYVCTDALVNFASNFLPQIKHPFVLVSGDGDTAVSAELLSNKVVDALLRSELLISWFAQNLAVDHPKVKHLPIGLDFHTMWERPGAWGISALSSIAQENTLFNTLAAAPAFNDRYMNAYCNWRAVPGWGDRDECYAKIDRSVCLFETGAISRASTWQRQSEFMFVVSPEGIGMDCHRTWEAIVLGCVPIVKRSAVTTLFIDLPVLVVNEWEEVNSQTLSSYAGSMGSRTFNYSPVFREYWVSKFAGKPELSLDLMTHAHFKNLLTRHSG
jgi:hypothetical protein